MITKTKTLFEKYFSETPTYDELLSSKKSINDNWKILSQNLTKIGAKNLTIKQEEINWLLAENGVTYNVYNDPKGLNRPWDLNIVPYIIHQKEWDLVEKGIQQRSEILNLILKDLYGKRELFKNGILPPEVIYAHSGFLRSCDQIQYKNSKQLLIYAADLARGPDGQMWVVNDRTQAPSGMGYALENRFSTSKVIPELYTNINVEQPSQFFNDFNQLLINAAPTNTENPMVVILTPGPHNETYFEHSYLSSFLGFPLVKGNDLVVRNSKVWLKSLKGLKQVDVILRRIDDSFVDPLELREDSYLGVAGLLEVVRLQNVAIVNPIGSGVLENPALVPFMENICKYFLDEKLILPQIASWWCGQEKEREHVLADLPSFVVKRIDRSNREHIYFCEFLDKKALEALKKEIIENPYKFVAQEKITFSTAPNFVNHKLEPRKILCRTFSIAKNEGYSVMPGGLVRVAAEREKLFVSNQRGGTSKDFWVINDNPQPNLQNYSWNKTNATPSIDINDVPSNTAENLFWSGRYLGRTLVTARYLRMVLNQMAQVQYNYRKSDSENLKILYKSITKITSTFPGFTGENEEEALKNPLKEIESLILDETRIGSFAQSMQSFNNSYFSLRNLWSKDMWRVFDGIQKHVKKLKKEENHSIYSLTTFFDKIITRLIAFMALTEESILVRQGLLLYFIGLELEISAMSIEKFRALLIVNHNEELTYEVLESLLNSHESLNIYRYSYKSYLSIENVVNLLILDPEYSRSLTYKMQRLKKDINKLPNNNKNKEMTICQENIEAVITKMERLNLQEMLHIDPVSNMRKNLDHILSDLSKLLHITSLSISDTYFNHSQPQKQLVNRNISN
ncbi:circularly permuted type 2 ATP-grasp protein [Lacinutrix sp. C3R15]|uniref:circularly permuted type 2 ATP-grasp protein n=1 Tax=Flavobacteriaceae TaxID=49546 RepID=UPI001C08260B|nr:MULTISPECIES: circularly permuted type 2 ATP-grasp protein [Flavobacteriaceae]MBU2938539.1 circularly permuted type 2 ATP-grasp protein [Lacinutrix sp. C3R15]MDO6621853.1 circularly permuted type 2 ATP-grasp protein [Oceanihabitans sp. 1_MG-2023]